MPNTVVIGSATAGSTQRAIGGSWRAVASKPGSRSSARIARSAGSAASVTEKMRESPWKMAYLR